MFCGQCGAKIQDGLNFCENCGARVMREEPVVEPEVPVAEPVYRNPEEPQKPRKKNKILYVILAAVILVAIVIAAIFIIKGNKEKKQYEEYLNQGNTYLEAMDYEQAEAAYLSAIEIEPRKPEPYIQLADIYVIQGEVDKAIDILEQAQEVVDDEIIDEKLEEVKIYKTFRWYLQPTVQADEIYYVTNFDGIYNNMRQQFMNDYVVAEENGELWFVDVDGQMYQMSEMKTVKSFYGDYCVSCENGESFFFQDGEFEMLYGRGIDTVSYVYFESDGQLYYVYDEVEGTYYGVVDYDVVPIPVKKAVSLDNLNVANDWNKIEGKYAIYADGELKTDFIYDEVGSFANGLLAVCIDGKWGYVDVNGNEIIPCEYDPSWKQLVPYGGGYLFADAPAEAICYAPSEGYIPLCKDGVWELQDVEGNVIVPAGMFEEICPVYNNKCWVKQNGMWGVIEFVPEEGEEERFDVSGMNVTFERFYEYEGCDCDCEYSCEHAVITATDKTGNVVWSLETDHYNEAQLSQTNEIGICEDRYYYEEDGKIIALSMKDGSLLWTNNEFKGCAIGSDFDDNGTLYVCGYFGPDLFIVDKEGKTVKRMATIDEDYFWPYEVEWDNEMVKIYFEADGWSGSGEGHLITVFLDDYSHYVEY